MWTSHHPRRSLEACGARKEEAFYTSSSGSLPATYYWKAAMEWVIYPSISQFPRLDSSATHSWDVGQRDSHASECPEGWGLQTGLSGRGYDQVQITFLEG